MPCLGGISEGAGVDIRTLSAHRRRDGAARCRANVFDPTGPMDAGHDRRGRTGGSRLASQMERSVARTLAMWSNEKTNECIQSPGFSGTQRMPEFQL